MSNLSDSADTSQADDEAHVADKWCRDGAKAANQAVAISKKHVKEALVNLARDVELFVDQRDDVYARIDVDDHLETHRIESRRFRAWLAHRFYLVHNKVPNAAAIADALAVIDGRARYGADAQRIDLANRFAWYDDALWYDLADDEWRAVRIDQAGWQVVEDVPALFRRYSHQLPQVLPEPDGDLRFLLRWLNIAKDNENDQLLILVWIVAALLPDVARAVLIVHGPQGSAKTMLCKLLRLLVDPSSVPMPRFPRGDDELALVLDHHAMIGFDNASVLRWHVSDTLCRAVTGDGFSKRKLYSDDTDVIRSFRRALVLNGICVPATKPDLLDRSLLIKLDLIPEGKRREEREINAVFEMMRPQLFGAVLTGLSRAMRIIDDVKLLAKPRMADWSRWCYAIAEVLGYGGNNFLQAYRENRRTQNREALTSHPVGSAVQALMADRDEWTGTPSKLLEDLNTIAERDHHDKKAPEWPKSPSWVTRRLAEVETVLLYEGIGYERSHGDDRCIRIWKTEAVANADGTEDGNGDADGMPSADEASQDADPDSTDGTDSISHGSYSAISQTAWETF